jgi:hypothetical protein
MEAEAIDLNSSDDLHNSILKKFRKSKIQCTIKHIIFIKDEIIGKTNLSGLNLSPTKLNMSQPIWPQYIVPQPVFQHMFYP